MSINSEYRAREREGKRESRRQASETQREKGRQRSRARDKKQRTHIFLLEEQHGNFVAVVTKWEMLAATNARRKWAAEKKKWTTKCQSYKYKIGIQHFPLHKNKDYSLCIEILNADYQLWHKSVVTVYKSSSQGLTIQNTIIKKFSHRYTNNVGSVEYMYYIRMIINFQKTWTALDSLYSLHVLVDIPQVGNDLDTYPQQLTRNWMIDYGVFGKTTSILLSYRFWYQTG